MIEGKFTDEELKTRFGLDMDNSATEGKDKLTVVVPDQGE